MLAVVFLRVAVVLGLVLLVVVVLISAAISVVSDALRIHASLSSPHRS